MTTDICQHHVLSVKISGVTCISLLFFCGFSLLKKYLFAYILYVIVVLSRIRKQNKYI